MERDLKILRSVAGRANGALWKDRARIRAFMIAVVDQLLKPRLPAELGPLWLEICTAEVPPMPRNAELRNAAFHIVERTSTPDEETARRLETTVIAALHVLVPLTEDNIGEILEAFIEFVFESDVFEDVFAIIGEIFPETS